MMNPLLLHVLLLLIYASPLAYFLIQGQPGHQASAAGWAVGLLFVGGVWLTQLVLSSTLLFIRSRNAALTLSAVLLLHLLSAAILYLLLMLVGWLVG